jgi:hypothetical protein
MQTSVFGESNYIPPSDLPQRDDDLDRQQVEGLVKPNSAILNLFSRGLVVRWSTMAGVGDDAVVQLETIIKSRGFGLVGEARFVKSPIQPVPAAVAGKHSTGPIGTVCSRSQSNDQQPSFHVAKVGNRASPIIVFEIRLTFDSGDFGAVLNQSIARLARVNRFVELFPTSGFRLPFLLGQVIFLNKLKGSSRSLGPSMPRATLALLAVGCCA